MWEGGSGASCHREVSTCISNEHCHPVLRPQNANEMGHSSPVLLSRALPANVWHTVNFLFSVLILCACFWHLGKSCSQEFGGIVYLLADFSFGCRWNKMNDPVLEGFFQIHMLYLVATTLSSWPDPNCWMMSIRYMSLSYAFGLLSRFNTVFPYINTL